MIITLGWKLSYFIQWSMCLLKMGVDVDVGVWCILVYV